MKTGILALFATAFLAGTTAQAATLDVVKQRGELRCGVSQGVLGFSARTIRASGPASTSISAVRSRPPPLAVRRR